MNNFSMQIIELACRLAANKAIVLGEATLFKKGKQRKHESLFLRNDFNMPAYFLNSESVYQFVDSGVSLNSV